MYSVGGGPAGPIGLARNPVRRQARGTQTLARHLTLKTSTMEKWTWPLLYGGIILLIVGAATWSADTPLAQALVIAGALLVVAGAWLTYLRSRIDK